MRRKHLGPKELNEYLQENRIWVGVAGEIHPLRRVEARNGRIVLRYGGSGQLFHITLKNRLLNLPDKRQKLPQMNLHDDEDEMIVLYCPKDDVKPVMDCGYDDWL